MTIWKDLDSPWELQDIPGPSEVPLHLWFYPYTGAPCIPSCLGINPTEKIFAAAQNMCFPTYLKGLEPGIQFLSYCRHLVPRFSRIVEPIHQLKTDGFCPVPTEGSTRLLKLCFSIMSVVVLSLFWQSTEATDNPVQPVNDVGELFCMVVSIKKKRSEWMETLLRFCLFKGVFATLGKKRN